MFHAPMVDLAKSPAEVTDDMKAMGNIAAAVETKPSVPEYPYGCCISLDDDVLEKLGLAGDMPSAGEMIHLCAVAKVTNASMSERIDSEGNKQSCSRIELQIIQMGVPGADGESRPAKWYDRHAEPDADDM